jgi:tetratricopeptide (TPR) repeat protein
LRSSAPLHARLSARMLVWIGIATAAIWLVVIGGGWLGIYDSSLRIVTVSIAAIVLGGWAAVAWRRPVWRPRSVLMPAILACLGSLAISTAFSRVPRVSLEYLGYAILLAALYLLLVRLMATPFFRARLTSLGAVLLIAIAIVYVVVAVWLWIGWWQEVGRIAIPPLRPHFLSLSYGNPSAVLTIVTLFAIPAAARWSSWRPRGMLAFGLIAIVVAVVALLSGSRAGWLALGVTSLVAFVAMVANPARRQALRSVLARNSRARVSRIWRIALPVIGLVGIAAAAVLLPAILDRVGAGGEDLRTSYVAVALRLFSQSPIVGTGPGTWTIGRIANTNVDETDYYIPHAHDVPAQTLAELGLLGGLAGIVLIASLAVLLRSAARSAHGEQRRWAWLTGLGLLYFGLHQVLDFYPNMPAVLFAAALPVAYLDATAEWKPSFAGVPARLARLASAAGAALVVVAIAGLLLQELPALQLAQAVDLADTGDWTAALAPARAAAAADPDIEPYQFTAGLAADRVGDHAGAAAYFKDVADRDDLPEAWLNLAAEQAAMGAPGDALTSLGRALRLGSQRVEIAMPAGDLALRLGQVDLATNAFADSIVLDPTLAADPWWTTDPARAAAFPAIVSAASSKATPDGRWWIALMTGDVERAGELAALSSSPQIANDVIAAWTGDGVAVARLTARCFANPRDIGGIWWCARIEAHLGNVAQADRYRDQAEVVSAGSSGLTYQLRVNTKPVVGPTIPRSAAWDWGIYTYRRAIPSDMLVPGLVHLIAT